MLMIFLNIQENKKLKLLGRGAENLQNFRGASPTRGYN